MKVLFVSIVLFFISLLDKLIPKNQEFIVYNSFPDLSDNSFALFLHVMEKYPEKNNIWLVKTLDTEKYKSLISSYGNNMNYELVERDSFLGFYYYLRAKYVFFTHGLFGGAQIAKSHCVVNLWHGMPLKTIGF